MYTDIITLVLYTAGEKVQKIENTIKSNRNNDDK